MMHAWKASGVDVNHFTLAGTDDFPLEAEHEQGTIALLALRLSSDYGLAMHEAAVRDAEQGWRALQAEFMPSADVAQFDEGLTRTMFLRGTWGQS